MRPTYVAPFLLPIQLQPCDHQMAQQQNPPIGPDTIEMIESQVKRGKARKFFAIYKGTTIKTLVVFRKGPFGPKIMKARKDGFKGDVTYGVVTGSGRNLYFTFPNTHAVAEAMKVDGIEEKPPFKRTKLREFLGDNGLNVRPSLHLISDVAAAPNPEGPGDGTFTASFDVSSESNDSTVSSPDRSNDDESPSTAGDDAANNIAAKLTGDLKRLASVIQRIIERAPDEKEFLLGCMSNAASTIKAGQFEQAETQIQELGDQVKERLGRLVEATQSASDPILNQLQDTLKKLRPKIRQAINETPSAREELAKTVTQIVQHINSSQTTEAKAKLLALGERIKALNTAASTGQVQELGFEDAWTAAKSKLHTALETADAQMEALAHKLKSSSRPELQRIAEFGLGAVTGNHRVPLMSQILEVDAALPDIPSNVMNRSLAVLERFIKHIDTDPRVLVCDRNPYSVNVSLRKDLGGALREIESVLRRHLDTKVA